MPKKQNLIPKLHWKQLLPYLSIFITAPILTFLFGNWLDEIAGLPKFLPVPMNLIFGFLVFFPGLAIGIKSTRELYKKGYGLPWGELNETSKSKKLVTNGLYTYCRNPMTLGYSLLPSGMGIMFRSLSMTFIIPTIIITVATI
ncbi:MAG: hypothetical protein GWO20_15440, partial [Candidatus Korarchaeota archaeon]|nr:hypothetical protein [Candidatus Korarchaeota archaeon]